MFGISCLYFAIGLLSKYLFFSTVIASNVQVLDEFVPLTSASAEIPFPVSKIVVGKLKFSIYRMKNANFTATHQKN